MGSSSQVMVVLYLFLEGCTSKAIENGKSSHEFEVLQDQKTQIDARKLSIFYH
jgi:hypothetical protein